MVVSLMVYSRHALEVPNTLNLTVKNCSTEPVLPNPSSSHSVASLAHFGRFATPSRFGAKSPRAHWTCFLIQFFVLGKG